MKDNNSKYICVVVTYNRKKLLLEAIGAILNQTLKPYKVIVYDNHSDDGSREAVDGVYHLSDNSVIDYIYSNENLGGSAGYYNGLKAAMKYDFDWIALSDDDAIYDAHYFERIIKFSQAHPDCQAFTGTVRIGSSDGEIQYVHRKHLANKKTLEHRYSTDADYSQEYFKYDIATFVGLVIKKELVMQIGLPIKDFFIWNDDMEYSLRIRKYSDIINVNSALVVHKTNLTAATAKPSWKGYYGFRNYIVILNQYGPNKVLNKIYPLIRLSRTIVGTLKPKYKEYRRYRWKLYICGYLDGIHEKLGKNKKFNNKSF